ncbi:MarR family winged helix-turn-helix transcriptional regulator [Enterococcus pallens]|uniref:MarR family transcriptional regulator n=1 Tax=Enterococcus pallens ATCC BAA-351 TaxID=1158607 RepID=R2SXN8_9ENTE|nr:MarR family transcriptional regulator [Enterococcus pallens]EOH97541.1 MarR family transcriptional regulator [Enterococcus pallens ATCC BAA-351]EOU21040.1 MarR family transcriptional regulator [Enterococcus pallens ATCC BAA-351]OJG77826.1 MarR family transcriptional regulator [Enterococcus pallens]
MNEVLREIGMIARALDSISNIEFKELDLNRGQYLYLVRIYENPGIIQEQLAELIMVDRTTISRAINRLQEKGFIYRQEDPINKKIKRLYVTEKGQELYPYIMRENEYSTQTALAGLTAADIQQLQEALSIVRGNVSSDWEFVKKGNKRNY